MATEEQPSFHFGGFKVERLLFEEVERHPLTEGEMKPQGGISGNLRPSGKLVVHEVPKLAELTLRFVVEPDPKWQPYRIEVVVTGLFGISSGTMDQFVRFCQSGAPSILFPYMREIVWQLTRDARHGPVRIDPINMHEILKWQIQPEIISSEPEQPSEQSPSGEQDLEPSP